MASKRHKNFCFLILEQLHRYSQLEKIHQVYDMYIFMYVCYMLIKINCLEQLMTGNCH